MDHVQFNQTIVFLKDDTLLTLELLIQITSRSYGQSSNKLSKVNCPVLVIIEDAKDVACESGRVSEAVDRHNLGE